MSDDAKKRLRDLAKQVREKVTPTGAPLLHQKGLELVEELATELSAPDGMPGLKVWRDSSQKIRLTRAPRNAEITLEWHREIGALGMTCEKHGDPKVLVRYVWDEAGSSFFALHDRAMQHGLGVQSAAVLHAPLPAIVTMR